MDKYKVMLMAKATRDLDGIYNYIKEEISEINIAIKTIEILEEAILSLTKMPYRGSIRRNGKFSDDEYHQLFVKNFTIIYRIIEEEKKVIVVTVRCSASNF